MEPLCFFAGDNPPHARQLLRSVHLDGVVCRDDHLDLVAVFESAGRGPAAILLHGNSLSSRTYAREYTMGTLLIGFFDVDSHELVWVGSAEARVDQTRDPEQRQKRIQEAVDKILSQFPPRG